MPHRLRETRLRDSLRLRVGLGALVLVVLIFLAVTFNTRSVLQDAVTRSSAATVQQVSQLLNLALSPYTRDEQSLSLIRTFMQELLAQEGQAGQADGKPLDGLTYILLFDDADRQLAGSGRVPVPLPPADTQTGPGVQRGELHWQAPIVIPDGRVGTLRFGLSAAQLRAAERELLTQNLQAFIGVMLAVIILLAWQLTGLGRRLRALAEAGAMLARGSYARQAPTSGRDELSLLGHELNAMADAVRSRIQALEEAQASVRQLNEELEQRVAHRTAELVQANRSLAQSLEEQRRLQDGLVRSEKLASLGSLVAAVAHELNTPIGNALTVATGFGQKAITFEQQARVRLQRQALEQFLDDSAEASRLLQSNLTKASELITSFKHVAIDQTSSLRRRFDLAGTVADVLATLAPGLRHRPIRVETRLAPGVNMRSYPGPLGQVLTNLYTNALLHAFEPDQPGVLRIETYALNADTALIEFSDNGRGMDDDTRRRIFDPFFTTRLGQGGSGLGMHIVHNIVYSVLQGGIEVQSAPGEGTRVSIRLPIDPPSTASSADLVADAGPTSTAGLLA